EASATGGKEIPNDSQERQVSCALVLPAHKTSTLIKIDFNTLFISIFIFVLVWSVAAGITKTGN
ncbi:MAG TPA: hypothetical protein VN451_09260, partial [Chitinophagaceae bacterium]|nr:hypothetical protein [Chitinophagaceae bacterium]